MASYSNIYTEHQTPTHPEPWTNTYHQRQVRAAGRGHSQLQPTLIRSSNASPTEQGNISGFSPSTESSKSTCGKRQVVEQMCHEKPRPFRKTPPSLKFVG